MSTFDILQWNEYHLQTTSSKKCQRFIHIRQPDGRSASLNKHLNSFLYMTLLGRGPDLHSNTAVPPAKDFFWKKYNEIIKSKEYNNILQQDRLRLLFPQQPKGPTHGITVVDARSDTLLQLPAQPAVAAPDALPPPAQPETNDSDSAFAHRCPDGGAFDIFSPAYALWMAAQLRDRRLYPTKMVVLWFRVHVLAAEKSDAPPNFHDIYLLIKKHIIEFLYNDYAQYHLAETFPPHMLNAADLVILHYNLCHQKLPSVDELQALASQPAQTLYGTSHNKYLDFHFTYESSATPPNHRVVWLPVIDFRRLPQDHTPIITSDGVLSRNECLQFYGLENLPKLRCDDPNTPPSSQLVLCLRNKICIFQTPDDTISPMSQIKAVSQRARFISRLIKIRPYFYLLQRYVPDPIILIHLLYRAVLQRRPDKDGLFHYYTRFQASLRRSRTHGFSAFCFETCKSFYESAEYDELVAARNASRQYRIKYYGPVGTSGYAVCAKLIVWALHHHGVSIQFVPIQGYRQTESPNQYDQLVAKCAENAFDSYDLVVIHSVPHHWPAICATERAEHAPIYGITVGETERLPREWIRYVQCVDMISVPCDFNKRVFDNDLPQNAPLVRTVRHPIYILDTDVDTGHIDAVFEKFGVDHDTYVFYTINAYQGRKGISELIELYITSFQKTDNVFLYIKTFGDVTEAECEDYIDRLRARLGHTDAAPLFTDFSLLSDPQINGIHARCHCFVSMTKGEGTGYSACQAALLNKPIIISNYSATPEYITHAHFVDVDLGPALYCDKNYEKHKNCGNTCKLNENFDITYQLWGIPRASQVRDHMRRCRAENIRDGFHESAAYIRKEFTFEKVAENFVKTFEEIIALKKSAAPPINAAATVLQIPSLFRSLFDNIEYIAIDKKYYHIVYLEEVPESNEPR